MKRIVFVTGDKGGVGKSFTSRALLDWYVVNGVSVKAFDTDKTNSTLFRFFNKTKEEKITLDQLDTDDQSALDNFLEEIAAGNNEICMIDCAARTMDKLLLWMKEIAFFELAKEYDIKITLAFVLGPEKDCVAILKDVVGEFGNHVDYVLIKNEGKGMVFRVYDESNTRKIVLDELSGKEISIPQLYSKTSLEVDRMSLPFSMAKESTVLGIADKSRVRTFQNKVFSEFEKVKNVWI